MENGSVVNGGSQGRVMILFVCDIQKYLSLSHGMGNLAMENKNIKGGKNSTQHQ